MIIPNIDNFYNSICWFDQLGLDRCGWIIEIQINSSINSINRCTPNNEGYFYSKTKVHLSLLNAFQQVCFFCTEANLQIFFLFFFSFWMEETTRRLELLTFSPPWCAMAKINLNGKTTYAKRLTGQTEEDMLTAPSPKLEQLTRKTKEEREVRTCVGLIMDYHSWDLI